jgi:hypothetical protein
LTSFEALARGDSKCVAVSPSRQSPCGSYDDR